MSGESCRLLGNKYLLLLVHVIEELRDDGVFYECMNGEQTCAESSVRQE